ncbi:MAG: hypothetical protein E4H11_07945 [Myxococcales bacterium]|nr:MAG: hypothetical protein E4H11_07945 [Myxococcales bacterium]
MRRSGSEAEPAVQIHVFEDGSPGEAEVVESRVARRVREAEAAFVAEQEPALRGLLVVAAIAVHEECREGISHVREEEIRVPIRIDVSRRDSHPEAVAGCGRNGLDAAVAAIAQDLDLPGVLRDDQILVAIAVALPGTLWSGSGVSISTPAPFFSMAERISASSGWCLPSSQRCSRPALAVGRCRGRAGRSRGSRRSIGRCASSSFSLRHPSAVGQRLVEFGCIRHVRGEHGFRDGHSFFRFREDEAEAA